MSESPRASLLGIPRDLRLNIYDQVIAIDLDYTVVDIWKDGWNHEFQAQPVRAKPGTLSIPWLNLLLSCKTISSELLSLMSTSGVSTDDQKVTYALNLEACKKGGLLGATSWRHIPCRPDKARILSVSYNCNHGFNPWGNGGPRGVTRGLYQTLNHFIHCGPLFNSRRTLTSPLHIQQLKIHLDNREDRCDGQHRKHAEHLSDYARDMTSIFRNMASVIQMIQNTGVIAGFVDQISLSCADEEEHWVVKHIPEPGLPHEWAGYGFEWGMDRYQHEPGER